MRASVRLMGLRRTRQALKDSALRGPFTAAEFTEIIGERVLANVRYLMEDVPKTGRIYERAGGFHQASAPGEAPAVESGVLIASLTARPVKLNQYAYSMVVGTDLPYAYELEFYGPDYNGQPRPFLQPAVDMAELEVGSALADAWNRYRP